MESCLESAVGACYIDDFDHKEALVTNMEKITYLKRYSILMRDFERQWSRLEELQSKQGQVTANYGPKVGGGSVYRNRDEDLIIKIVDLRDEALLTLSQALDEREELCRILDQLDPNEWPRLICDMRYLYGWTWDKIAADLEFCHRHIHNLHGKALAQLEVTA